MFGNGFVGNKNIRHKDKAQFLNFVSRADNLLQPQVPHLDHTDDNVCT